MKRFLVPSLSALGTAVCLGLALPGAFYEHTDLLSDQSTHTRIVNPDVINAWGLASSETGPFWIANEGTGTSSVVLADGTEALPDVAVPSDRSGHPTGLVFNRSNGFPVHQGSVTAPSRFIFVTLEGRLIGWSPTVDLANAIVAVDNGPSGAVYTGAAIAPVGNEPFLYVANFAHGTVDVFDASFQPAGTFTDPNVPAEYAPFGIAAIDDHIFVTFVPRDPVTGDEVPGPGHGLIDVFRTDGSLLRRLVTGGELNAPWAMVRAPDDFGPFGTKLLVGNFGDGRILAYGRTGMLLGPLMEDAGQPIVIEGLWGLEFGNGGDGGDEDDLYYTAGPGDETHGVFGEIEFSG